MHLTSYLLFLCLIFSLPPLESHSFIDDLPDAKQWHTVGIRNHHGIALPLSSLRGKEGAGIGEFLDLIPMVDWCESIGFDCIQLLPINDTGTTASPYSPCSSLALHPMYLSLSALPLIDTVPSLSDHLKNIQQCNSDKCIDYEKVQHNKEAFLRDYYSHINPTTVPSEAFTSFVAANPWLEDHGLYKILKIAHGNSPWRAWPKELQNPTPSALQELKETYRTEIDFYAYVQFLCFEQWKQVKEAAEQKGIHLVGDLSIMVSRDSSDVWLNRDIFQLDYTAGAPPNEQNTNGQNWGLPIYNWDALQKSDYSWWKERLKGAETLYHIIRIDNVHSFFQFWAIPEGKKAKKGSFSPQGEHEAIAQGKQNLSMLINNCKLLPIGEGMSHVPDSFRETMQQMGIGSIKSLLRIHPEEGDTSLYNSLNLTCVSTHDTETLTQWWKSHHKDAKKFVHARKWHFHNTLTPSTHKKILKECHTTSSLFHINLIHEYLRIFPQLSWKHPDDDRINMPGLELKSNWTFRLRPIIDEITSHEELRAMMKEFSHLPEAANAQTTP